MLAEEGAAMKQQGRKLIAIQKQEVRVEAVKKAATKRADRKRDEEKRKEIKQSRDVEKRKRQEAQALQQQRSQQQQQQQAQQRRAIQQRQQQEHLSQMADMQPDLPPLHASSKKGLSKANFNKAGMLEKGGMLSRDRYAHRIHCITCCMHH
jgi:hypothetical protein